MKANNKTFNKSKHNNKTELLLKKQSFLFINPNDPTNPSIPGLITTNYLEEIDLSVSRPDESCVNVIRNAREALADLLGVVGVHLQVREPPVLATLRRNVAV